MVDTFHMLSTDAQIPFIARILDVSHMRHAVIAQNMANVNTPGYVRHEVLFEEALTRALASSKDPAIAPSVEPKIVTAPGGPTRQDGNNVDMDMEVGQLNKNSLIYKVYTQVLATRLAQWRSAISGR